MQEIETIKLALKRIQNGGDDYQVHSNAIWVCLNQLERKLNKEIDIKAVAKEMHDSKYDADFHSRDGWLQDEYIIEAKAAIDEINRQRSET